MNVLLDPAAHPVIAHRGNSAHAPENTFASFDQAIELGADALEFDVRLTRDGRVVVIHDATLERTTNGRGEVRTHSLAELRGLDAGAQYVRDGDHAPFRGRGVIIPTLDEMLERYDHVALLIEVKVPEAAEPTLRLLERFGAHQRTVVDSSDASAVEPFRGKLPTGASSREVARLLSRVWRSRLNTRLPYDALCIPRWYKGIRLPVARLARLAASAGTVTHVWTINEPAVARALWRAGVNGIVTDDPATMIALRAQLHRA